VGETAEVSIDAFYKRTHKAIAALTRQEILDEQITKELV
jgi:hypothetical protein